MFYFLRALLFLLVLYFLFRDIHYGQICMALQQVQWGLFVIAILLYGLKYIILGLRWRNALLAHEARLPVFFYIKGQIEIAFLEMAFPLPDSEDALRIIKLSEASIDVARSATAILFDRAFGVVFLLLLVPFTGWYMASMIFKDIPVNYPVALLIFIGIALLILNYRILVLSVLSLIERYIKGDYIFFDNIRRYMDITIDFKFKFMGLFLVFAYGLTGTLCIWALIHSLGITVSFLSLFLCIPFFYVNQTFPLSYQGLGLYEATLVFILQKMGVDSGLALACGTLHFTFHIMLIFMGGYIFLASPSRMDFAAIARDFLSSRRKVNKFK